jgi:hypothetical protein
MGKSNLTLWYERSKYSKKNCAICKNMIVLSKDDAFCDGIFGGPNLGEFSSQKLGRFTLKAKNCPHYESMMEEC